MKEHRQKRETVIDCDKVGDLTFEIPFVLGTGTPSG